MILCWFVIHSSIIHICCWVLVIHFCVRNHITTCTPHLHHMLAVTLPIHHREKLTVHRLKPRQTMKSIVQRTELFCICSQSLAIISSKFIARPLNIVWGTGPRFGYSKTFSARLWTKRWSLQCLYTSDCISKLSKRLSERNHNVNFSRGRQAQIWGFNHIFTFSFISVWAFRIV
jgi:hypothetical protein